MFDIVKSELLLEAPIIAVRRDTIRMPGGTMANREVVEHFGAVAIVALNEKKEIALIEQYRHSVGKKLLEIPAGLLDIPNENPLHAAQRELHEEAGLKAKNWHLLADMISTPGFCDEVVRIFLATDLEDIGRVILDDDEESVMTMQWCPLDTAVHKIFSGEISNGIALAAILLAQQAMNKEQELRDPETPFDLRPTHLAHRRSNA